MSLKDLYIPYMKYDDLINRNACFDGTKCIDLVLVFDESDCNDSIRKRKSFFKCLLEAGFELRYCDHTELHNIIFVFVHTPLKNLYKAAEKTRYKVPIEKNTLPKNSQLGNCLDNLLWNPFKLSDEIDEAFVYNSKLNGVRNRIYFTAPYSSQWKHKFFNFWRAENLGKLNDFISRKDRSLLTYEILSRIHFDISTIRRTIRSYMSLLRLRNRNSNPEEIFTEIGLENLLDTGVFEAVYPLHEPLKKKKFLYELQHTNEVSNRQLLWEYWARPKNIFRFQPMYHIKEYFGEKVAFYFSWLGFYTTYLLIPSIASIFVVIYGILRLEKDLPTLQICDKNLLGDLTICPICENCATWKLADSCTHTKITNMFDNSATVGFAILMGIWNVFFINYWKRQQNECQFEWDTIDYENKYDVIRPDYERKFRSSEIDPFTDLPRIPLWKRFLKLFLSTTTILLAVSLIIGFLIGITSYKLAIEKIEKYPSMAAYASDFAALSASVINLMTMLLFKRLYYYIAMRLTKLEWHKTDKEFEDALAIKMYLFQFVNNYSSIFYVGFIQRFGSKMTLIQPCQRDNCYASLCIQLATILVGKQLLSNISEYLMPYIWFYYKKAKSIKRKISTDSCEEIIKPQWQEDYLRPEWKSIYMLDEYLEMILQYGYIVMFVAAFPLAPLFGFLNNLIEIRVDAHKFIAQTRRPLAQRARDIGVWVEILIYISKISTITNAFIIAFTSDYIPRKVYMMKTRDSNLTDYMSSILKQKIITVIGVNSTINCSYRDFGGLSYSYSDQEKLNSYMILVGRLTFVVIFEHLTLACGFLLNRLICDMPTITKNQIEKENTIIQQAIWQDKNGTNSSLNSNASTNNSNGSSSSNLSVTSYSVESCDETVVIVDETKEPIVELELELVQLSVPNTTTNETVIQKQDANEIISTELCDIKSTTNSKSIRKKSPKTLQEKTKKMQKKKT